MKSEIYSPGIRCIREILKRTALRGWRTEPAGGRPFLSEAVLPREGGEAAVYIVHHQNLRGPVRAAVMLPMEVRIWALHVFCRRKSCFQHYRDYTFRQRLGWPQPAAAAAAGILCLAVPRFLRGAGVVAVYRGSREIQKTMAASLKALEEGESLLICPDRDYASDSREIGDIYKGFLHLERGYYKRAGKHLAFVPLCCDEEQKRLLVGEAVYFKGEQSFAREAQEAAMELRKQINELSASTEKARPRPEHDGGRKRAAADRRLSYNSLLRK